VGVFVIGDRDTVLGLRLAGAEGKVVRSRQEAEQALQQVLRKGETDLLLITRQWSREMQGRLDKLRMERLRPAIVVIPGRELRAPEQTVGELVQQAIGISLGS
jgi:V/A-type H+-transporting ATPase subunit F